MPRYVVEFQTDQFIPEGERTPLSEPQDSARIELNISPVRNTLFLAHYSSLGVGTTYYDHNLPFVLLRGEDRMYMVSRTPLDWDQRRDAMEARYVRS